MTIDYEQLRSLVKEAMFTGGGINEPSAPEGIPHRMPAADTQGKEQDMGDPQANEMYDVALTAREAAERLVVALDDPAFDQAYEYAFKASACLRKVLNSIEASGAHPMPDQRVVAPPRDQQRYSGGGGDYAGGAMIGADGPALQEASAVSLGRRSVTKGQQAAGAKARGASIAQGDKLAGLDDRERAILQDVEEVLYQVADRGDLDDFRSDLERLLKKMLDATPAQEVELGEK